MADINRELSWLHRNLVFSKRVAIFGADEKLRAKILGEWLLQVASPRTIRIEFKALCHPSVALANDEDVSFESALSTAELRWNTGLVIIWEGLQFLAPKSLGILNQFLSSSNSNALHILCGDRSSPNSEFPCLILGENKNQNPGPSIAPMPTSETLQISSSALDALPRSDLIELVSQIQKLPKKSLKDVLLLTRARFLSGQRQKALEELLQFIMDTPISSYLPERDGQELFLEALRQSNRAAKFQESKNLSELLRKDIRISDELRPFFNLEITLAQVHSQGLSSIAPLDSLIEKLQDSEHRRALAESIFQRARIFDAKGDASRALFDYQRAGRIFRELNLHYQACTAFLNSAWLLANDLRWPELNPILNETLLICSRFGYPHILASLETIQSQIMRLQGRPQEALSKIDLAIARLETSDCPSLLMTDTIIERARILLMLGQRSRAALSIHQTLSKLNASDQLSFSRLRALQNELNVIQQGAMAWLENQSINLSNASADLDTLILAAEHALLDGNAMEALRLEKFSFGKLALQQSALLKTLSEEGPTSNAVLQESHELIRAAEVLPECRRSRALSQTIRAQLLMKIDAHESSQCLAKAKDLVLSSGAEESAVTALSLWIEAIEKDSLEDLPSDSRWQKTCALDREQFENWIFRISPSLCEVKNCVEYFSIAEGRLAEVPTANELQRFQESSLFIDDQKAVVLYKGRNLRGLNRKGVLYDFIKALMQSSPDGLAKEEMAALVWGENYNPSLHDPRIYVATQRLRTIFKDPRLIVQHRGRYGINPERAGLLIREKRGRSQSLTGNEKKILMTLQSRSRSAKAPSPISRGELQNILGLPEATLKRGLKSLLMKREISALGAGRSRTYRL